MPILHVICRLVVVVPILSLAGCPKTDTDRIKAERAALDAERDRFQGVWRHVSLDLDGRQAEAVVAAEFVYRFDGNQFSNTRGNRVISKGTFTIVAEQGIDFAETGSGATIHGIYRFEGDRVTLCLHESNRPTEFESKPGQVRSMVVLQREK